MKKKEPVSYELFKTPSNETVTYELFPENNDTFNFYTSEGVFTTYSPAFNRMMRREFEARSYDFLQFTKKELMMFIDEYLHQKGLFEPYFHKGQRIVPSFSEAYDKLVNAKTLVL